LDELRRCQASEEPSIRICRLVDHPYNISLSEFGRLPMVTEKVSCISVGWPPDDISINSYLVYAYDWTGMSFPRLLERAGVQKEAVDVVIHILELELLC
jgi:DMSO/TMAO reductase YedYZ molybdopterin-dependent catalytic subunit